MYRVLRFVLCFFFNYFNFSFLLAQVDQGGIVQSTAMLTSSEVSCVEVCIGFFIQFFLIYRFSLPKQTKVVLYSRPLHSTPLTCVRQIYRLTWLSVARALDDLVFDGCGDTILQIGKNETIHASIGQSSVLLLGFLQVEGVCYGAYPDFVPQSNIVGYSAGSGA